MNPTPVHSSPAAQPPTVSAALVDALHRLGVRQAFGVMGGAMALFFRALEQSEIQHFHLRHEAGAAFAAVEASLATRRPVLVFTTAGPGLSNVITGMLAARSDGAHVIFVSATTPTRGRGRVATQETTPASHGAELFGGGGPLHYATIVEHPAQLGPTAARLAAGLARPGGFVAHLSLPIDVQNLPASGPLPRVDHDDAPPLCAPSTIDRHAALVAGRPLTIWLGFGARHAAEQVRCLAERTGARVMCTPRGKGIFPEDHPQFIGVTGVGGHPEVDELLRSDRPEHTLVLGTRMGETSSFWLPALTPSAGFIHVDTDPTAFGAAFPEVPTFAALADVGRYCAALLAALGKTPASPARVAARPPPPSFPEPRTAGPVRPQQLMAEIQRVFVDGSDAWLMAESGNSFCWTTHLLRFARPGRYRLSTGLGSMGHATSSVVGAALARGGKAIAVVGDGAMMMQNELHSAVQYGADALWIVLNDACYQMCAQGMRAMGWEPWSCALPRVDFVALARAIGADGERVTCEAEVGPALARAARVRGPWVLDVNIDPAEIPPSGRRNQALMQQGNNVALARNHGE